MNYTVYWVPIAEGILADLWTNAPDRRAVTVAANQIEVLLQRDPLAAGQYRPDDFRILTVPPLAVSYDVDEFAREVTVWAVWRDD